VALKSTACSSYFLATVRHPSRSSLRFCQQSGRGIRHYKPAQS